MREALALTAGLLVAGVCLGLHGRPTELTWLRRLWWGLLVAKVAGIVAIYAHSGSLGTGVGSDARLFYIPQGQMVLDGRMPIRDFPTVYLLFPLLVAPLIWLWWSVGSVALLMVAAEAATVAVYLRSGVDHLRGWRIALLVSASPLSLYWTAATGYDDALIALAIVGAIVLATKRREGSAGVVLAVGLLFTKLLTALAGFAMLDRAPRRAATSVGPTIAVCGLLVIAQKRYRALDATFFGSRVVTTGSIAHLLHEPSWVRPLSFVIIASGSVAFASRFLCDASPTFDDRAAVWAATGLLLLLVSPHAFSSYEVAFLLPLYAALDRPGLSRRDRWWLVMAPVVLMAAISPAVEFFLARPVSYAAGTVVIDVVSIVAHAILLVLLWRRRTARVARADTPVELMAA